MLDANEQKTFLSGAKADSPDTPEQVAVKGSYAEFGGSRKRPRYIGDIDFTGILKGNWIHLDSGGKKKKDGNHIKWVFV